MTIRQRSRKTHQPEIPPNLPPIRRQVDPEMIGDDVHGLRVLIPEGYLQTRIKQLALEIRLLLTGNDRVTPRVHVVVVMDGAAVFAADLLRLIPYKFSIEYLSASSYGDERTSSGTVKLPAGSLPSLKGVHVLIIEDIIDTGHTINALRILMNEREASQVTVVTLLDKPAGRKVGGISAAFTGFTIPDVFVIGYGMDNKGFCRNLPDIWCIDGAAQ